MYEDSIAFPHLHILLKHVGKRLMIGNFSIAFYGIVIALGMVLAFIFIMKEAKRVGYKQDDFMDLFIFGIIFGVIGARIYYVIFSWDDYKNNLLQIFNIRGGGLAIYGGIIGGTITVIVLCHIKKLNFWKCADVIVFGVLIGQICGRWGNFFNREAFGGYTDGLFAMRIPIDAVNRAQDITAEMKANIVTVNGIDCIQVHPTFLYESLFNLCVFLFLLWYRKRKKFDGEIFFLYIGLYGIGRSIIEGLRTDQLLLPGTSIAVSQLLGLCLFVGSAAYLWFGHYRRMIKEWSKKE
ncbi:MAG TPA: prolipoprotein diacylglyceryl transferase [Lachnospiraceae bacterium]|nr:prolipoprotein diacylglyceryl transferase [Lachnospiraceae bacterium]MDD7665637.1 prolipoprotein diacylglyceryl transferase [Lachnospiraceae bacterium]MDY4165733.1 prolipoprotein diacylglyceryl transferase [Lachnospiraceae bacterium]HAP02574.1 prolipoprotein diacylglyceryl transferase [Lachnospiraceae bacterium]